MSSDSFPQEALHEILSTLGIGLWMCEVNEPIVKWSDELFVLFGRAKAKGSPTIEESLSYLLPDEQVRVRQAFRAAIAVAQRDKSSTTFTIEHAIALADGESKWIENRGRIQLDDDGALIRVIGIAVDISQRKREVEAQRVREETYRLFSELASDYVYVVELDKPTLVPEIVGGSFERTTGLRIEDVEARGGWTSVIHPDDSPAVMENLPTVMAGRPLVSQYRILDSSGQVRWLRDVVRPLVDGQTGNVTKLMGGVQDITERKRLEGQLAAAQKLEALARLSGTLAHDFNNLLSVITGSVSLLESELLTEAGRESCEAIMEAAKRGVEQTSSLLLFARRDAGSPEVVELHQVVQESLAMLKRAVGSATELRLAPQSSATPVRIDRGQAQLLLLNLVVNAKDAMDHRGTVELAVTSSLYRRGDGLPDELSEGMYVCLQVRDHGTGIPPEVLANIFDAFFTTKPAGKGTGLGLSACHNIVSQAEGAIQVSSTVGLGTSFSIYLPYHHSQPAQARSPQTTVSTGGTERILLVEDESVLCQVLARALRERGYLVDTAPHAENALTQLISQKYHLLLSDIMLPAMSGTALAQFVRTNYPNVRMLLMTGYRGSNLLPTGVAVIGKPFSIERLVSRIREVLDQTPELWAN